MEALLSVYSVLSAVGNKSAPCEANGGGLRAKRAIKYVTINTTYNSAVQGGFFVQQGKRGDGAGEFFRVFFKCVQFQPHPHSISKGRGTTSEKKNES